MVDWTVIDGANLLPAGRSGKATPPGSRDVNGKHLKVAHHQHNIRERAHTSAKRISIGSEDLTCDMYANTVPARLGSHYITRTAHNTDENRIESQCGPLQIERRLCCRARRSSSPHASAFPGR